jgi:tetratricopeptide (TPR) repeat protein
MQRALAAHLQGHAELAAGDAVTAIVAFRSVGDICTLVPMLHQYSRILQSSGNIEAAEAAVREARDVSDSFRLRGWQSTTSRRLGGLATLRGDHEAAVLHYRTAIDLAHELALPHAELAALKGLALAHNAIGDHAAARQCDDAARAITDRLST